MGLRDPLNFFTIYDCEATQRTFKNDEWRHRGMITIEKANALICEALGPKMVGRIDDGKWACDEHVGFARATHTCHLFCMEKLK